MRSSEHPIRRAIIMSLCFVLCVVLATVAITVPWMRVYQDNDQRDALAGTIDTLYVGASYGVYGIVPSVFDAKTGASSYNICGLSLPVYGIPPLLKKELARNPVKRVYIVTSFQTLTRNQDEDGTEGDVYLLPRLGTLGERLDYARRHIPFENVLSALSQDIFLAIRYFRYKLFGGMDMRQVYADRGYSPFLHADMRLSEESAARTRNASRINTARRSDNLAQLREVLRICRDAGVEVAFVSTPLTNREIWQHDGWDDYYADFCTLAKDEGVPFYDFNLLKARYTLFDDALSYGDQYHLCDVGAHTFSEVFADVMKKADSGENVSDLFYADYMEMKADSPYTRSSLSAIQK